MQHAWIIAVGTELTLGQTVDTNTAWLATQLAGLGIRTQRHITVPDELEPIRDVLLAAADATELVLVTGGLGPTDDDLTRPALAAAADVPLEEHADCVAALRAYFATRGRPMHERNLVQTLVPRGGRPLLNTCGTAPGLFYVLHGTPIYILPGVPFEMKTMFARDVLPELRAATAGRAVHFRRLHTIGVPESELGARIADLMQRGRNPEVGTTADLGIIGVRINATAETEAVALTLADATEAEVRPRLGSAVFGRDADTLAAVVGRLLEARGATVATAESCTGGVLGALFTDTPGSSRYYVGGVVTYANEAKTALAGVPPELLAAHGAVSGPVAEAMARGAAQRLDATYALSITGIAGPDGGTADKPVGLVYIGLATPTGVTSAEWHFGTDAPRHAIRMRAAHTALNTLRLALA